MGASRRPAFPAPFLRKGARQDEDQTHHSDPTGREIAYLRLRRTSCLPFRQRSWIERGPCDVSVARPPYVASAWIVSPCRCPIPMPSWRDQAKSNGSGRQPQLSKNLVGETLWEVW